MPPVSQQQAEFMRAVCRGDIPPPEGMTREQACEFVEGHPTKDLPHKAREGCSVLGGPRSWLDAAYGVPVSVPERPPEK